MPLAASMGSLSASCNECGSSSDHLNSFCAESPPVVNSSGSNPLANSITFPEPESHVDTPVVVDLPLTPAPNPQSCSPLVAANTSAQLVPGSASLNCGDSNHGPQNPLEPPRFQRLRSASNTSRDAANAASDCGPGDRSHSVLSSDREYHRLLNKAFLKARRRSRLMMTAMTRIQTFRIQETLTRSRCLR